MTPEVGDQAPEFELQDAEGKTWRLSELKGQRVVLFFYPADDTPGCTIQACEFRDARKDLADAGYTILGVSPQGADSKKAFSEKYGLDYPLLIDQEAKVARDYGVWKDKGEFKGIPILIERSTFVIDEEGNVAEALYGVKPRGHVEALKEKLLVFR
jgi:peroxiredoxin Q/BCP